MKLTAVFAQNMGMNYIMLYDYFDIKRQPDTVWLIFALGTTKINRHDHG